MIAITSIVDHKYYFMVLIITIICIIVFDSYIVSENHSGIVFSFRFSNRVGCDMRCGVGAQASRTRRPARRVMGAGRSSTSGSRCGVRCGSRGWVPPVACDPGCGAGPLKYAVHLETTIMSLLASFSLWMVIDLVI